MSANLDSFDQQLLQFLTEDFQRLAIQLLEQVLESNSITGNFEEDFWRFLDLLDEIRADLDFNVGIVALAHALRTISSMAILLSNDSSKAESLDFLYQLDDELVCLTISIDTLSYEHFFIKLRKPAKQFYRNGLALLRERIDVEEYSFAGAQYSRPIPTQREAQEEAAEGIVILDNARYYHPELAALEQERLAFSNEAESSGAQKVASSVKDLLERLTEQENSTRKAENWTAEDTLDDIVKGRSIKEYKKAGYNQALREEILYFMSGKFVGRPFFILRYNGNNLIVKMLDTFETKSSPSTVRIFWLD